MKILYLYLNPIEGIYKKILEGELPSNHLYGFVEFENIGYDVSAGNSQPTGVLRKITTYLNKQFEFQLKDFKTLYNLRNYDVIVVKGPFSTQTTIICRLFNKKIVYLDPILRLPRNYLRKVFYSINLKLADGTVVFSRSQFELILKTFKINHAKLKLIPFCLDTDFFRPIKNIKHYEKPFILSVGMDIGRDYGALIDSIDSLNVDLKIVTLPYLLKGLSVDNPSLQIFSNIPYKQLFELYAESLFVVIPLKKWATQYSSGTTNLLEAKLLGKAVISTYSRPLEEYLEDGNGVYYVEAENVPILHQAINKFLHETEFRKSIQNRGSKVVSSKYNTYIFAELLGAYLEGLLDGERVANE